MGVCMNIKVEMLRRGLTVKKLAAVLGISEKSMRNKINGLTDFTLSEADRIHSEVFPDADKDTLFTREKNSA